MVMYYTRRTVTRGLSAKRFAVSAALDHSGEETHGRQKGHSTREGHGKQKKVGSGKDELSDKDFDQALGDRFDPYR
jgi:hypothetical protein